MKLSGVLLVLLLSCALLFCDSEEEENEETLSEVKEHWVDPHNMVDEQDMVFERWLKNNADNNKYKLGEKNSEATIASAFSKIQEELRNCKQKLLETSLKQDEIKEVTSCDTPYFKQLVRVMLEATSDIKPQAEITLSEEHRETLRKFLHDDANVHDVIIILLDSITNRTISDSLMDKYMFIISSFLNTETIILLTILILLIATVIIFEINTRLSARQQFLNLLVVFFIISIPWEWYRLYKKEFANKQSIMMESLQKHCHTDHELGPIESVGLWWKSSFSTVDSSCAKYQEALLVDAIWEVAPSLAVSVTLTRFFVQPLEHIADATGKSFRALFQHLPLQWQPFMFLACILVVILCLILVSGFRVSTPFLQFGVGAQPALNNEQLLKIENQMKGLQQIAENQNAPAIENVRNDDQRMQAVLDIARALNERSQKQEDELREIRNNIQALRQREGNCRRAEAVEHQDFVMVDRNRLQIPVEASDHPTDFGPVI